MDVTGGQAEGRIGVLGGSFDPIHNGHLIIAQEVCYRRALSQVLFIPAQVSPLKVNAQPTSAEHRARMVELAIANNPAFALSRIDLDRPGPSYTVDTLALLREELGPRVAVDFIVGQDSLKTLLHWRDPETILRLCHLVVVRRPGYQVDLDHLEEALPALGESLTLLDTPELAISSTDLRRRVCQGWPIRYQVPEAVEAYIRQHGLYLEAEGETEGQAEARPHPC